MAIDRRTVLKASARFGVAVTAVSAGFRLGNTALAQALGAADGSAIDAPKYMSAVRLGDGGYAAVVFDAAGTLLQSVPLAGRGHDATVSPSRREAVVFARRPGTFAVVIDLDNKRPPRAIAAAPNRHFYGHGVFSPDGALLYATENDLDTRQGRIGLYDATNGYRRLGEFQSHGIGPHDLQLSFTGRRAPVLIVANGGIETHPETGRAKLNLDTMQANIAVIDTATGDLLGRHEMPQKLQKMSIRHLDMTGDGAIWFGCQWEGDLAAAPSLVGRADLDGGLDFLPAFDGLGAGLRGYISSMAVSEDGATLAVSASRAGRIFTVDIATRRIMRDVAIADGSGVAALPGSGFIVTSGAGAIQSIDQSPIAAVPGARLEDSRALATPRPVAQRVLQTHAMAFDNHVVRS